MTKNMTDTRWQGSGKGRRIGSQWGLRNVQAWSLVIGLP